MKKYFAWGAAILVATAGASLVAALPARVSYCGICGARHELRGYGVRFTHLALFQYGEMRATPFSHLLEAKHLVMPHPHQWQEPRLVPDPLNEFGPPVVESIAFLNTPRVLNFTRNVADYADPSSAARWAELVRRPEYPRVLDASLRFLRVPEDGFADRTAFLTWWGNNSFAIYNRLREVTESD
ncbi:MAG: hypothetical protein ACR2HH_04860 [Chthoniobacterales bacterium]